MRISSHVWFFSVFDGFYFLCLLSTMEMNQSWKKMKTKNNDKRCLFYEFTLVPFIYESFWHTQKNTFLLLFNEMHMFHLASDLKHFACDIYLYLKFNLLLVTESILAITYALQHDQFLNGVHWALKILKH